MLVRFRCKDCGQKYQVPDNYATGEFRCVECGGEMEIPENSTLNDRPAVDLGTQDVRPLVNIPVAMKASVSDNTLESEKDFIEEQAEPQLNIEPVQELTADSPTVADEEIPVLKPSLQPPKLSLNPSAPSPTPAPPGKLSLGNGSSLQMKPPAIGKTVSSSDTPAPPGKLSLGEGSSLQMKPPTVGKIAPPALPNQVAAESTPPPPKISMGKIAPPGSQFCDNHPHLRTTSACNSCHKPICLECRNEWGYFCSDECRDASMSIIDRKVKSDTKKENAKLDWIVRGIKIALLAMLCVVLAYIGMWAWREFLDPGGKVAWSWKHSGAINYLRIKPDKMVILSGNDIITLDTQTGKVRSSFSNKIFSTMSFDKIVKDKIIVSGEKEVAALDFNAKTLWRSVFKDPVVAVTAGSETALVTTRRWIKSTKVIRVRGQRMMAPDTAVTHRYVIELEHGKKLRGAKLDEKSYFRITAVGDKNYISIGTTFAKNKVETVMKVSALRTGKALWQIKLPSRLSMGPLIYKGNILFRLNDSLHAVSMAGKKLWTAKVTGYSSNRNFKENDGLAFFSNEAMLSVFDLNKGKILWSKALDAGSVSYVAGKLLMRVTEEDKEYSKKHANDKAKKLPPAYEKLKKGDPVLEAMLSQKGDNIRYNHFLICLDAQTGEQIWKSKKINGQLVVGAGRAVIFRDFLVASKLSAITTKRLGKSIIQQLDLQTGELLFRRKDDIGVSGLMIVGDKLIGHVYDRNYKDTTTVGIAAFNLK
ncbi:MAG: PQQ-binding-like beta-propeller repeat protein [Victivallaceae bacterium]|nr:PQQ-binding-like beta-propeller repeat protein [Victivallaceae bacterium]